MRTLPHILVISLSTWAGAALAVPELTCNETADCEPGDRCVIPGGMLRDAGPDGGFQGYCIEDRTDGGAMDASPLTDAAAPEDAAVALDAGAVAPPDAALPPDAATAPDAGTMAAPDGGTSGAETDAGAADGANGGGCACARPVRPGSAVVFVGLIAAAWQRARRRPRTRC